MQENVELVRESVYAFNRGDLDAVVKPMHPDIEWQSLDTLPNAGTYRGLEGVREFWQTQFDMFRGFRLHLENCVAVGEHYVLATISVSGEGTRSGVGVESPGFFQVGEIRDGQVMWSGQFSTVSDALEAAALRE